MPRKEQFKAAARMAINIQTFLKTLTLSFVATFWNLGILFYFGAGRVGFVFYLLVLVALNVALYVFYVVLVFRNPKAFAEIQGISVGWKVLWQIYKDG